MPERLKSRSDTSPGRTGGGGILRKIADRKNIPFFLLFPAFLYYTLFWVAPVITGVVEAFTDQAGRFTLDNFTLMLRAELFSEAVINTATFAAVSVLAQYLLALLLAVLLNRKFLGSKMLLFIVMIPMAITPTAVAILWKTGFMSDGWVNSVLFTLGLIKEPIAFLSFDSFSALFLIIIIDTWTVLPSVMIILLAGLQGIHEEYKTAAYLFGANRWQIFKDIVLPILKPSIITSIILRLIAALQVWAIAVMVLGFSQVPFLVERIAYYVQAVPGIETSEKLAFTFSLTTTVIVFATTMIYFKLAKRNSAVLRGV